MGVFYDKIGLARIKEKYYEDSQQGSYMFYFSNPYTGSICCKDATEEDAKFGWARLINHSRRNPNCIAMAVRDPSVAMDCLYRLSGRGEPKLVFVASRNIHR